ncbi:MAG: hypothetical protein R2838_24590 [Caldilineaceae bacterium]
MLSIKGIGNYAAHTLLAILGYYGEIAVDTEYRNFVTRSTMPGRAWPTGNWPPTMTVGAEWKYLAYWFGCHLPRRVW